MRKARRIAAIVVVAVAAGAIGVWFARDQPRRIVQAALAGRLGAEVSVGSLHFDSLSAVRLGRVVIRMHAAPGMREVRIAEIQAFGSLREMAAGRFEALRLVGLDVVLDPAAGAVWPTAVDAATVPELGRLDIADGRLTVASPDGDSVVNFAAHLTDVGRAAAGTVTFTGDRVQLDPLLSLAGIAAPDGARGASVQGLSGELRLAASGPRLELQARADGITVAGRALLDGARIEGTASEEAPGLLRVVVTPSLPSVDEARIEAALATSPWRVASLHAVLNGVDAAAWSRLLIDLPEGWKVAGGTIDAEAAGAPSTGVAVDAEAHDIGITGPIAVRGNLSGHGELRIKQDRDLAGWLELTGRLARLPSPAAPNAVLDAVLPLTLAAGAKLAGGGRPLSGSLRVATAAAGGFDITGTAGLGPSLPLEARWSWRGGDLGRLVDRIAPDAASALPGGLVVAGETVAEGRLSGDLTAPSVSGQLRVLDLAIRSGGAAAGGAGAWRLHGEEQVVRFAWTRAAPTIEVEVPETRLVAAVDPLAPVPVVLSATGTVDVASGGVRLRQLVVDAGSLGSARIEADWRSPAAATARLEARVDDLGGWLPLVAPLVGDTARGATASGTVRLDVEATRDQNGWRFGGPITVAGAGLSSADGSRVLEGLGASARLTGGAGPDGSLNLTVGATLGGFQVLWGTRYADYSDRQAVVDVAADRRPDGDATVTLKLELPPQASLDGTLRLAAGAAPAWEGSLAVTDVGGFWERWFGVPFQGTLGGAGRLRVDGGELRARLSGAVAKVTTASGEIRLDGLSIASANDGLRVDDLRFRLPVDLGLAPGGDVEPGDERRGSFGFDRLAAGGVQLPETATALEVLGDSVTVIGSIEIPLLGGEVALDHVELAELVRPSRYLAASVGLHALSLSEMSRALGLPPLEGDVSGRFPRVRFSDGILVVDGTGELSLFGGTVTVSDIAGSDLLTRYPRLELSAQWRDIDLAQVTRTFDFGAMTGIVEGHLTDLEIFGDVPVRFRGVLRSVPRKGVPQRISLKAVNNIAIAGTGSGLGFIDRGLRRFIKSYAYASLGIEMALVQDHFLLRGLERRGDRELFIKGRFPLRLDVVNVEPGTTVSFRTMIERLRSLDVAAMRTQP